MRLTPVVLVVLLMAFLSLLFSRAGAVDFSGASTPEDLSRTRTSKLMQESDCKQRLDEQHRARLEDREKAALAAMDNTSGDADYALAAVVIASAAGFAVLSLRNRRARPAR